jgi:hypothetical protein
MGRFLSMGSWNPYIAGVVVGLLALASVLVTTAVLNRGIYIGASTTFVRAAGFIEQAVDAQDVAANVYYQSKKVKVDWQMLFVVGIFCGAFVSSRLGGTQKSESVPQIWWQRFGHSAVVRAIGAFIGGVILMFGARLAGGCPSGHGMSGNMQLAVSSLLALVFFMVGGIVTARILYRKGDR